ncbi:hypothetical protein HD553DRAFT_200967 [Filobasidium floriforme]|uniref:uncharacterized protein n=1 Tax=Filobasidium floriforme TaxID=5210 RepID=UPI001E8D0ECB|nr:uncharacterized protein HD553DRAFT_200967 [Filobasidium floriforme]KAH8087528.1 hypothetical protein HD553DRAFT_200967 [Filobasidium floriforme]
MTDTADLPKCVHANSMDQETSPRLPTELFWQIMSWSEAKDLWRYLFINRDFEAYIFAHRDYEFRCDVPLTKDLLEEWHVDAKRSDLLKRIQTLAIQAKDLKIEFRLLPCYMRILESVKIMFPLHGFLLTMKHVPGNFRWGFDASITFEPHFTTRMVSAWSGDYSSDESSNHQKYRSAMENERELYRIVNSRIFQWRGITRTNTDINCIRGLDIFPRSSRGYPGLTALDSGAADLEGTSRSDIRRFDRDDLSQIERLGLNIGSRCRSDTGYNNRGFNTSKTGFLSRLRVTFPMLEELDLAPTLISWKNTTWLSRYDSWPILELGHLKVLKIAVDFAGIDDSANWTADSRLKPDVEQSEVGGPKHLYIYIDFQRHAKIKDGVIQTPGCDPELIVRWIMQVVPRNSYVGVRDFRGPESKWLLQTREALYQARRKR